MFLGISDGGEEVDEGVEGVVGFGFLGEEEGGGERGDFGGLEVEGVGGADDFDGGGFDRFDVGVVEEEEEVLEEGLVEGEEVLGFEELGEEVLVVGQVGEDGFVDSGAYCLFCVCYLCYTGFTSPENSFSSSISSNSPSPSSSASTPCTSISVSVISKFSLNSIS